MAHINSDHGYVSLLTKKRILIKPNEHIDPLYITFLLNPPGKNREIDEGFRN
jgi:hypothetical protein